MFFFENTKLKSHLFKLIRQTKIKVLNKQVKAIDPLNNKIITNTSSKIYDLIILCLGPKSKIYKNYWVIEKLAEIIMSSQLLVM